MYTDLRETGEDWKEEMNRRSDLMELVLLIIGILLLFAVKIVGVWLGEKPKVVKKVGNRRYYVKWNKER